MNDEKELASSKKSTTENKDQKNVKADPGDDTRQGNYYDPKHYNNDPENMANYSGNFGTGTYDTEGKPGYPSSERGEMGNNWIDETGRTYEESNPKSGSSGHEQKQPKNENNRGEK